MKRFLVTLMIFMALGSTAEAGWSEWMPVGGILQGGPSAVALTENRVDVFVRGTDGAMYHKIWNGSAWGDWENLGGELSTRPSCVSWSENRIDCIALGTDNRMYRKWWDGSWKGWEVMGGEQFTSAPSLTSWGPGRLDMFVRGKDNALWHATYEDPKFSSWESLGGVLVSDPGCTSWGQNRIDCFVQGTDNRLYHRWWDGRSWQGWENLGSETVGSAPSVTSLGENALHVFAQGPQKQLWHKRWDGKNWLGWESLEGTLTAEPGCVSKGLNRVDCFVRATDGSMYHKWWVGDIPVGQGKYRVRLAGFKVNTQTEDHKLEFDGKGDEVYLMADVRLLDAKGNRVLQGWDPSARTKTFGDTNKQNGRIKAGSARGGKGGLITGDEYPQPPFGNTVPSEPFDLPMTLWEGVLEGENAVIITPVIFEFDGSNTAEAAEAWFGWVKETSELLQNSEEFKQIIGPKGVGYLKLIGLAQGIKISFIEQVLGKDGDRPIGSDRKGKELQFQPQTLVLNREKAERLIDNQIGPLPGVFAITYNDKGGNGPGDYTVFIQVQRIN